MARDDVYGSPEHQAFRAVVRKFVQTELAPRAREFDEMGRLDKAIFPKMGELGLARHPLRPEVRRPGARLLVPGDLSRGARALRQRRRLHGHLGADRHGHAGAAPLRQRGAEAAATSCPRSAASRWPRSRSPSRARAPTSPASRTRAVRDGDHWVINGSKMYITNAATADWLCLLAVTDPDGGLRRLYADHRAHRHAGLQLQAPRQDRQQRLGHRPPLLRRRARADRQHDRRRQPRLPAADDAVPGRAHGARSSPRRSRRAASGSRRSPLPSSACCSGSRSRRCRSIASSSSR